MDACHRPSAVRELGHDDLEVVEVREAGLEKMGLVHLSQPGGKLSLTYESHQ